MRQPGNRAAAVAQLREWEAGHKALAVERAGRLGWPVRQDLPGEGGTRELMGWEGDKPLYFSTLNANAAISSASSQIRVAPYLAEGLGGTVGVWDAGSIRSTHQEFGGRVTIMDGAANHYHSTHVGGTIGATGIVASAKGMAPKVRIDSYDWNYDSSEMASRGAAAAGESGKIYVSNHSYGALGGWVSTGLTSPKYEWYGSGTTAAGYEDDFGRYNTYARDVDALAFSLPYYAVFWAAGNDRTDNPALGNAVALSPGGTVVSYDPALHPPGDGVYHGGFEIIAFNAVAKNVITVGAVNDAVSGSTRILANGTMTSFSCWGPTDDGRIKPDVVANGNSLYSTYVTSDTSYAYLSGTSMATPSATGTAQQLVSYYESLFPGQDMRASTLKGLLIHTADNLGTAPGPNYTNGWGLINAKAAADLITMVATNPAVLRLSEQVVSTSTPTRTYRFTWDGSSPIRATLCWTDPAGVATTTSDLRTARLVNNLNLRIVSPTGTQHFPWVMPFVGTWTVAAMSLPATTGTNNTDNVEQVLIASPPSAGVYEAIVSYSGTLSNSSQAYSLLVSGSTVSGPDPQAVSPDAALPGSLALTLTGANFQSGATVSLYRSGQADVPVTVGTVTSSAIEGTLDASLMVTGPWNLRTTNPDGRTGTMEPAFTVLEELFDQSFDGTVGGWTHYLTTGTVASGWALATDSSQSAPQAYKIVPVAAKATDNLESEAIPVPAGGQQLRLRFWHKYNLESYDGGQLQLSWNGGTFTNVTASGSGASFVQGGYSGTVSTRKPASNISEFAGTSAWTGNSGSAFAETIVSLDPSVYAGKDLRVRWRLATDTQNTTGLWYWYVDSVNLTGYDTANQCPFIITPAAANPSTVAGASTALSVAANDDGGEAALTYTWSVSGGPAQPVGFSPNGSSAAKQSVATFTASGSYSLAVSVRDGAGLSVTDSVPVSVAATPTSVAVSPASAEVEIDGSVQFEASVRDQFGFPLDPQPTLSWDVSGGGTIDAAGLFAAGAVAGGPHMVTASALGLEGTAEVSIVEPPPVYVVLGGAAVPSEGGEVSGAGVYLQGSTVEIGAAPAVGWRFTGWSGQAIADPNALSTTVSVWEDQTVTAHFEERPAPILLLVR